MKISQMFTNGLFFNSFWDPFLPSPGATWRFLTDLIPPWFFWYLSHLLPVFLLPSLHAAEVILLPQFSLVSTDTRKSLRFLVLYACLPCLSKPRVLPQQGYFVGLQNLLFIFTASAVLVSFSLVVFQGCFLYSLINTKVVFHLRG